MILLLAKSLMILVTYLYQSNIGGHVGMVTTSWNELNIINPRERRKYKTNINRQQLMNGKGTQKKVTVTNKF